MVKFLLAVMLVAVCVTVNAEPWGSGFSYQGELRQQGNPADGLFDFKFSVPRVFYYPYPLQVVYFDSLIILPN